MQTKKVMCTLMAAFLVVNTTLQPVLATGDLLINSQTTKTRQLTVGSDTATTNGSTDAVQITADVTTTKQLPTTKKQLPTQTTDVQAQQHVLAGDPNGGACIAKIETCNNIDDDCDGLVDEGLNCTTACPDADADGICDAVDNCKFVANPNQADADGDGIGDVCEENGCIAKIEICNQLDDDCDGLVDEGLDCSTPCPDADGDGICNAVDNCKFTANPNQADADGDGVGDVCDNCVNVSNANQADSDGDGIGDACETTDICDPHVFVSCETTEDLNNPLNYGNQYECSELIKCYAHFANYNSPTCKIQYEGTIKALTGGTVVDDPNFVEGTDCQNEDDGVWFEHEDAECALNTATNTVECNGTLYGVQNQNGANDCNPNTHDDVADVGFWVQLDTCDNCSPYFELEIAYTDINLVGGGQFVDQNYGNNVDTYTHDIDNSANPLCNGGCVDTDNDGICDTVDNCVNTYNPNQADIDGDGVGDVCDNCVTTYNPNQADSDNDGIGDACETIPCIDTDGDGICNPVDNCVTTYNPNQADADGDGVGDVCDNCVNTYNPNQADSDNDGIGDACEVVDVCPDPISNIVVTSHVYDQVINGAIVSVFSGTVQGNAVKVDVIVGGTTYTDVTIVNGVWSVNNVLLPVVGQNPITILAYHANGNAQCIFGTYFQLIRTQNSIITTCTDTQVTPQQVELNQGNFTITCGGTNANSYAVKVTRPNNTTTTISIPNGGNVLQVAGAMTGTYNFQCIAYGSPTAYCPVATGVVVQTLVCPDPITNFTLSSHAAAGQPGDPNLVSTPTVTMTGTIAGGYGSVEIIGLNAQGQMVVVATATILNGVWSATVPVSAVNGAVTAFWIKAKHLNSNDLCTETIDVRFKFVSGNQCTDPITNLTIGSHFSGQVVNSSPITLTGLVQGGVLKVEVMVGVTVYQATILNGVWSVTLPLVAGTNSIWVKAYPNDADCSPVQKDIVIKYQPSNVCTDPITNLTIGSHFSGQVVNSSPITLTGLVQGGVLKVEVMVGVTVYQATILNGVWSVTLPLVVGTNSIWVKAYPNDADCSPVQIDTVIKYQPNLITTCTETQLQPTNVVLNQGNFTITCQGTNVTSFKVQVTQPNGFVTYLNTPINNAGNQFQFTPQLTGGYTFACHAEGFNDTICPSVGGTVTPPSNVCTDPITNLTIGSHFSGQVVNSSPITLTGLVQGGVLKVEVMVGVNVYQATILNGVWSVNIPLVAGTNNIWVKAYPNDADCSPVQIDMVIKYQPSNVCTDPITNLTIGSHFSGQVVNSSPITLTGLVQGGVLKVEVMVGVTVYQATILNGVWSVTLPLVAGTNSIWVKAYPNDADCSPVQIDMVIKYQPSNVCTDPITNLTIGSHFSGQVVNSSPITLTGLVQGGVLKVEVMVGVTVYQATILNGVWSVTLPLVAGTNSIWVKAYPNDADCSPVQKDIVIKYQPNLITTCTETQLQPTSVALNQGDFTISCQGTNVTSFKVQVTQPNGFVTYLTTPINNAGNQFQFTPLLVGGYTFACHAEGFNDTICPSVGGTVTNTTQCTAPLNYMHIDAPLSGLITSASTILVQGTILPSLNVQSVLVNGIVATISGSVYTAIVPLQLGTNKILATATSIDADCPTLFAETTVYRTGGGSCDYLLPPEAVTITSPFSGAVFNTNSIVVSGTSWTDIVSLTIKVNGGTVRTVTPVNGLWSGSVALVSGVNTIEVIGYLSDPTCQPVSSSVVIKNTTSDGICLDTIALTVTEPTNNLSVTTSSVLVQGVVLGSGITLKVGNSTVIPNANGEYSFMYPLVIGTNTLVITASNGDDDCTKTTTVNVVRRSSGGGGGGRRSSITCGNGYLDRYEQCDDGNYRNGDGCSSSCQLEQLCGNNKIEAGETCDDGNTRNGDGCNAVCRLEDIDLKREVIKRVKSRPQPFVFVAPKILPKTGISSRVTPARQIK